MRTNANLKIEELIKRYPELNPCYNDIVLATELLIKMYKNGGKLLVCGNGGSASDSLHIVGELMKSFKLKRPISNELREKIADDTISDALEMGLPAISLRSRPVPAKKSKIQMSSSAWLITNVGNHSLK